MADRYHEELKGREPDVVDLLLQQHAAIERLFLLAAGSTGGPDGTPSTTWSGC